MARDDDGAAGTVILAFVLGTITGAAVALLMAPTSGEETRRLLAEKAREGRERANDAAHFCARDDDDDHQKNEVERVEDMELPDRHS